jgi:hypothetical protein
MPAALSSKVMPTVTYAERVHTTQFKAEGVAADAATATEKVESARLDSIQQRAQKTAKLLQDYQQARTELDVNKMKALADELGLNIRLSSEEYIDPLERAGAEARLSNEIDFREAMANDIFHEDEQLFSEQFRANEILNMKQNQ